MKTAIIKLKTKIYNVLRKSEKHTKTDMVYIAKNGFWITLGQSVNSVLSLILIITFANLLPKETYGLYRYILAIAGILNIFTLTGMNSAVSRAVATGSEGILKISVKYQLKWNLLMFLAFLSVSGYYFLNDNLTLSIAFFILGIFVPPTLALNTYGAYLDGKKQFPTASILNIISTAVYVVGMLITIKLSGETMWLIATYALATFITTFSFYIFTLHKFKPSDTVKDAGAIKYGRHLSFIRLIGPIIGETDKIILAHFWGATQLAVYSLSMAIPARIISFIKNWVGIGFPKFAGKTPKEINTVFYKRIFQGMIVGGVIMIFYILISPFLFKYLLPQYLEGILYSQILAVSFVFSMPNRYVSLLLDSQKLSRVILKNSIIQSILKIVLYIILGIYGGIMGLVLAFVFVSFIGMIVNIAIWRNHNKTYSKIL